jgi:hypothetical protein
MAQTHTRPSPVEYGTMRATREKHGKRLAELEGEAAKLGVPAAARHGVAMRCVLAGLTIEEAAALPWAKRDVKPTSDETEATIVNIDRSLDDLKRKVDDRIATLNAQKEGKK